MLFHLGYSAQWAPRTSLHLCTYATGNDADIATGAECPHSMLLEARETLVDLALFAEEIGDTR
jgi:hypothetical protein